MDGKGIIRGKKALATQPWWTTPSSTLSITAKDIANSSELKNDLSTSKWAPAKAEEKPVSPPTTFKENAAPITPIKQEPNLLDEPIVDWADDSDHEIKFSFNAGQHYEMPANANSVHSEKTPGSIDNAATYGHEDIHGYSRQPQAVSNNELPDAAADCGSDIAFDDDGDVVMMDLNDPGTIKMVAEVTRLERQADKMGEYAGPGLRPMVSSTRIATPSCLLIIDTSFIVSHLQLVNNLVISHPRWNNVVVMPWATTQELDGLKKSTHVERGISVAKLARSAINWAFGVFGRVELGVWGQTKEEKYDSDAVSGDAAILDCCRYFLHQGHNTVLLSNDRNLCVQAMVHNIKTVAITGEIHTAETILTHVVGNPTNPQVETDLKAQLASPLPPPANRVLTYNPASIFTPSPPVTIVNNLAPTSYINNRPAPTSTTASYRASRTERQKIEPPFYPPQDTVPYLPYGSKNANITASDTTGGLHDSIYAPGKAAPTTRHRTQVIPIVKPPSKDLELSHTPATQIKSGKSIVDIKNDLNSLLTGISKELITNLAPLLKQCMLDKLGDAFTLQFLNIVPEKQVQSIIDMEKFIHEHWMTVFKEFLPGNLRLVFGNGELNQRYSKWIYWAEFGEQDAPGPRMREVRKWIEEWDLIWKRILFNEKQTAVNMDTVDRWRTALASVGLATE